MDSRDGRISKNGGKNFPTTYHWKSFYNRLLKAHFKSPKFLKIVFIASVITENEMNI